MIDIPCDSDIGRFFEPKIKKIDLVRIASIKMRTIAPAPIAYILNQYNKAMLTIAKKY